MALSEFAKRNLPTLYVSGEESARQIRLRADRLQIHTDNLHLLAETDLDASLASWTFLTRIPVGGFPYPQETWTWISMWFPVVGNTVY